MGWRGTVRSIGAAVRAAERDARRRQRELERQHQQSAKLDALRRAALEVEAYENHIERLCSVHKECSQRINWQKESLLPAPLKPQKASVRESSARYSSETYTPSWFDRLFRLEDKKRARLALAITKARALDDEEYRDAIATWNRSQHEWENETAFARRVLSGDQDAYIEVIKEMNPFSEISELGTTVTFETHDAGLIAAETSIHGEYSIPREAKTLSKSGKVSVKSLPVGRFQELHQDYVCSCVLRIANELFALLPVSIVIVTAIDKLLNSANGHLELKPILSVAVVRATLQEINLEAIDPSDAMRQFVHRMDFKKTRGFAAVDRILPADLAR